MFKFLKSTQYTKTRSHLSLLSMAIAVAGSLTTPKASYGAGVADFQSSEETAQWQGLTATPFNVSSENVATQINTLKPTFEANATRYTLLLENARNAGNAGESLGAINALLGELSEGGRPKTLTKILVPTQTRCNGHTTSGGGYHHVDAQNWASTTASNTRNTAGVNPASVSTWVEPKISDGVLLIPIFGWLDKATKTYLASCSYSHLPNYPCGSTTITAHAQIASRDVTSIVSAVTILKGELDGYIAQQATLATEAANQEATEEAAFIQRSKEAAARAEGKTSDQTMNFKLSA